MGRRIDPREKLKLEEKSHNWPGVGVDDEMELHSAGLSITKLF
jgi:hypothetical protein